MKFTAAITLSLCTSVGAFVGPIFPAHKTNAGLFAEASRRDAFVNVVRGSGFVLGVLLPKVVNAGTANPFFEKEINFEPSQMARNDKIDINGAFVVSPRHWSHVIYACSTHL